MSLVFLPTVPLWEPGDPSSADDPSWPLSDVYSFYHVVRIADTLCIMTASSTETHILITSLLPGDSFTPILMSSEA